VACPAPEPCHDAGACDATTGACSYPPKANGTACNDGNACTQSDTCQAGACVGGNPVTCAAQDQCHDVGVCDPATGACSNPAKPDGSLCTDGDACTTGDTCQAGACVGGAPVTCPAPDACHEAGVCDPSTGACSNAPKPDGSSCDDGDACTQTDTCKAGNCVGGNPVTCAAQDECHDVGVCDAATGQCTNPAKGDGTPCSSGNCASGVCTSSSSSSSSSTSSSSSSGGSASEEGGCGCRTAGGEPDGGRAWVGALGLALALARRRRTAAAT
jgi:MYXO-CTERM domain-containing protein